MKKARFSSRKGYREAQKSYEVAERSHRDDPSDKLIAKQALLDDDAHALQVWFSMFPLLDAFWVDTYVYGWLQTELLELLGSARDTESKVLEISSLSHAVSTHVLQQAHQIEQLYNEVNSPLHFVPEGNF